ncbi:unnamed protein product [Anisakis simplex]|uniref:Uncharacterized protein n=1 Tax=Anisakis simplex TaxID=6269 RepID=A0A0M3JER0_ANISI|nr:unnamed protein product [Anisakis simplex]
MCDCSDLCGVTHVNCSERYYENYYGERAEYDTAADNEYEQDSGEDFARNVESDVNQYEVENQIQAE